MTWIKTNFLWMMYRCDWGRKDPNQQAILAIWLKRSAFENYLSKAVLSSYIPALHGPDKKAWEETLRSQKSQGDSVVRMQWDPDHSPSGTKHPSRRAVQIGLKNMHTFVSGEDIVEIQDITAFVDSQYPPGSLIIPVVLPLTCHSNMKWMRTL